MAEAYYRYPGDEIQFTATEALKSGDVIEVAGKAGVVRGLDDIAVGDPAVVGIKGHFEFVASAAISAGTQVFWNDTTKKIQPTSGDIQLGIASSASSADGDKILVLLNE